MSSDSSCASHGCGYSTDVSAASTCAVHVSVGGVFCCVRSSDTVSLYWCHYVATCETVGGGIIFLP